MRGRPIETENWPRLLLRQDVWQVGGSGFCLGLAHTASMAVGRVAQNQFARFLLAPSPLPQRLVFLQSFTLARQQRRLIKSEMAKKAASPGSPPYPALSPAAGGWALQKPSSRG